MRKDFALKAGTFMAQPFETVNVLGFDFINTTQTNFIEQLKQDCLNHQNRFIVTANPEIVLAAKNDAHYAQIIQTADYLTADGIGIVKGAKILGTPLPERVTGYDTMMALLAWCHEQHKLKLKPSILGFPLQVLLTATLKTTSQSCKQSLKANRILSFVPWVFLNKNTSLIKTAPSLLLFGWASAAPLTF